MKYRLVIHCGQAFKKEPNRELEVGVHMARLLSVNVGLPREIAWRGKTVYTSVWKEPVQGRRLVRRLNVDGDAQGDLPVTVENTAPFLSTRWILIAIGSVS